MHKRGSLQILQAHSSGWDANTIIGPGSRKVSGHYDPALAVNTPGVVINLVRLLTVNSVYVIAVSKSHHSVVSHAEKE